MALAICAALGACAPAAMQARAAAAPLAARPQGPAPTWAPDIDPRMLAVIEQLDSVRNPPIELSTPFQARNTKTATDAVELLLMKLGVQMPAPAVRIAHMVIPGPGREGTLVRTYTPMAGAGPFPVIVYYHGGGWVIADLDEYEPSAAALAQQAGAIVISVAYRQGPENRFPAAHEDAFNAYLWATRQVQTINGDPRRIVLAGESAGGNLAVAVGMMARQRSAPAPVHVLSVYPIADGDTVSASYEQYAQAKPLNRPMMAWFFRHYLNGPQDAANPLISLVRGDFAGFAPTTIVNAQIDPLRSDGEELAARMRQAGVQVEQRTFPGVTHEFFGMAIVLPQAVEAQAYAVGRLRASFGAR